MSAGRSDRHSRSLCHALVCQPDGANTSARVCARGRRCRRPQEVCSRSRLARAATDRRACVGVRLGGGLSVPALVGTLLSRVSPSARWRRQRHERGRWWGRSQPGRACKRRARPRGQGQLCWSLEGPGAKRPQRRGRVDRGSGSRVRVKGPSPARRFPWQRRVKVLLRHGDIQPAARLGCGTGGSAPPRLTVLTGSALSPGCSLAPCHRGTRL